MLTFSRAGGPELYLIILVKFTLEISPQLKIAKKHYKVPYFGGSASFKVSAMFTPLKTHH